MRTLHNDLALLATGDPLPDGKRVTLTNSTSLVWAPFGAEPAVSAATDRL